jgi:putative addiction module component (TIGR02574 family)
MAKPEIDINNVSPEERLDLIEELWDSLSTDPAKIPLTEAQANEHDRRMTEMDQDDLWASVEKQSSRAFANVSELACCHSVSCSR